MQFNDPPDDQDPLPAHTDRQSVEIRQVEVVGFGGFTWASVKTETVLVDFEMAEETIPSAGLNVPGLRFSRLQRRRIACGIGAS